MVLQHSSVRKSLRRYIMIILLNVQSRDSLVELCCNYTFFYLDHFPIYNCLSFSCSIQLYTCDYFIRVYIKYIESVVTTLVSAHCARLKLEDMIDI